MFTHSFTHSLTHPYNSYCLLLLLHARHCLCIYEAYFLVEDRQESHINVELKYICEIYDVLSTTKRATVPAEHMVEKHRKKEQVTNAMEDYNCL